MAEEENKKTGSDALKQGFSWAIFGAISGGAIGVLLSIFAIYNIGVKGLLGTIVLGLGCAAILFVAGFIVGYLTYYIPKPVKTTFVTISILIIIGMLVWATLTMWKAGTLPEYAKFASPMFEGIQKAFHGLAQYKYCLTADSRCPFFVSWDEPVIQNSQEEISVHVSFDEKKVKSDGTINLLVNLAVENPTMAELTIKPKCYLESKDEKGTELEIDRMGTYSYGEEFRIPATEENEEVHTQFYCYGALPSEADNRNVYAADIIVELERPVVVKTTWPVWIGTTPRKGIVKSTMSYNAPYTVSLASNNDMPFEEGKDYSFQITLQRKAEDVKFKNLQSLSVNVPEELKVQCGDNFANINNFIELRDASYDILKNITQYDENLDKFIFPCVLYVSKAGIEAVQAPMQMEVYYSVYSDYDTQVFKSP